MKWNFALIMMVLVVLSACQKKTDASGTSTSSQNDLYIALSQAAVDESSDSIAESGTSSSFEPLDLEDAKSIDPQVINPVTQQGFEPLLTTTGSITRNCTLSGGTASVLLSYSGTDTLSFTKSISTATLAVTVDVVKSGTETRAWSPASCNGANTFASIDWSAGGASANLGLEVTLNRTINRAKTITLTKASGVAKTWNATDDVVVTGTRNITWAAPTTSGTLINRVKVVTSNVSRVRTFTRASGASASSTAIVTVGTVTPLNVTVVRNSTNYGLVSKTINSGTVKVTESGDGSYSSCVFADVVYNLLSSNSNKCVPTSGTITCEQYASATASNAAATVVIKFGVLTTASGISVSVDGATAEDFSDYNTKGCDLETAT